MSSETGSEAFDLIFRTDDSRWGAGKGANLTAKQVDENFFALLSRLAALELNPLAPKQIYQIVVVGDKMTIKLDDGVTEFGPFVLPQAAFNWTGDFATGHDYKRMDILTAGGALYLVLQDHTSTDTFDPDASDAAGRYYALLLVLPTTYDVGFFMPGPVGAGLPTGQTMFAHCAVHPFYLKADLPGSLAIVEVPPTAPLECKIYINGDEIGSIMFAADESVAVLDFPGDVQFNPGDVLRVLAPEGGVDATAIALIITFAGVKGSLS